MSKTNNKEKGKDLLTITPKKTAKLTVINSPATPLSTSVVEENDIVASGNIESTEIITEPLVAENLVYELVFVVGGKEQTVYTKLNPQFSAKHILKIENAFGKEDLKEVVLGRKEVKACCRKPLEQDYFEIDLRRGAFIKVLEEQNWMNTEYETTKRAFDESVLKAYRDLSTVAPPPPVTGIPATKPATKPVKPAQGTGPGFGAGNLPIDKNRPRINEI